MNRVSGGQLAGAAGLCVLLLLAWGRWLAPWQSTLQAPGLEAIVLVSGPGALLILWVLKTKWQSSRTRVLDAYAARRGEDPFILTQVEQYRIVEFLGSGSHSKVYKALPEQTLRQDQAVAIKIFTGQSDLSDELLRRLQREIAIARQLDHPGIVRTVGSGEQEKLRYLIMEYAQGETLTQLLEKGRLDVPLAIDLAIGLGGALAYAHGAGIIHRDLKPDNILMTSSGPRIMDFGMARNQGKSSLTQSGSALGTPFYMSPEQIREAKVLDGRCDQYALGCLLFELLTGQRPFVDKQVVTVLMKHLSEPPPDPRGLRPEIPEALAAVTARMLAKAPADRFPDIETVVSELRQIRATCGS